jgi:hypothetical protein
MFGAWKIICQVPQEVRSECMAKLLEDIHQVSHWVVQAFAELGRNLDYSLDSLKDIDLFFDEQTENGDAKPGSLLDRNFGYTLFAISAYVGETLIKNCPGSEWVTDDTDPHGELNIEVKLANGHMVWPGQKVIKRLKNGTEDSLYFYVYMVLGKGLQATPQPTHSFFSKPKKMALSDVSVYYLDQRFFVAGRVRMPPKGFLAEVLPVYTVLDKTIQPIAMVIDRAKTESDPDFDWQQNAPNRMRWDGHKKRVWQTATHLWNILWHEDGSVELRQFYPVPTPDDGVEWKSIGHELLESPVSTQSIAEKLMHQSRQPLSEEQATKLRKASTSSHTTRENVDNPRQVQDPETIHSLFRKLRKANLPEEFPVIDDFRKQSRTITKMEELNIASDEYMGVDAIDAIVKGYIDELSRFTEVDWNDYHLKKGRDFDDRHLELAVPAKKVTSEQRDKLVELQDYAYHHGVRLFIVEVP